MIPMKHGYTNNTMGDGAVVEKQYAGPDAALRREREYAVLCELQGRLPVPPVRGLVAGTLRLGFVPGKPGQELLDAEYAEAVLMSCGRILGRIHSTEIIGLPKTSPGDVLVHGDFGPNNLLLDPETFAVTGVVDWEFAHYGDPLDDLAWCEWIVRMHHPEQAHALPAFFDAYPGDVPAWPARQAAMVARCKQLQDFCERWTPDGPAVTLWKARTTTTAAWTA
ncbi:aminoglycoside phosphotransferase [Kribbella flavida DSM 17836]|uniref:Aminoglycoside phosphotransferase n=1 Tax=Kribbella flavida (strain DSM 17836 / JCM 10339 / NBRC 14399) TaxID=479435 RepID=D2Q2M8_KRIFD|nr:phosphotransferase [Kribbella flavida]ADB30209.1 aminoglycoside phosphotransferase [Kribbella flavida DSM 17836]